MPACEFGAHTRPELVGIRTWLNADTLEVGIQAFLNVYFPGWRVLVASSLVDMVDLCEMNPDPPPPFDVSLLLNLTQPSILGPATPVPGLTDWIYRWILYQGFLLNCVCNEPPSTPGNNCPVIPPSVTLPALNAIAGPWPVTIDSSLLASWPTQPNGDYTWSFSGEGLVNGGADTGDDLVVQYFSAASSWIDGPDVQLLNAAVGDAPQFANYQGFAKPSTASQVRVVNRAGGSKTIENLTFCFRAIAPTPPPQPPFTPPTGVTPPPAALCSNEQICQMVTELARRLTIIARQVSDIQASVGGFDQLVELSRITMVPEGEAELVLGTRAVSVELTALGDEAFTSALGRPRGLMRVGSIRWGDGVGYSPRRFVDADRFDDVRPAGATSISWQLLPGTQGILKFLG